MTVGTHSGYVRCVAMCRTQNWIASGSFDRTIKLWDLTCTQSSPNPDPLITHPADPHATKSSVAHRVYVGSTDWQAIWCKLVEHTDNICVILLSEDTKYLLTGSADVTCDVGEGECVFGKDGINKLVVVDDALVWTPTSVSTMQQWRIPTRGSTPTTSTPSAGFGYSGNSSAQLSPSDAEPEWDLHEGPSCSLALSVLSYEGDDNGAETCYRIPYMNLMRLTSLNGPFHVRSMSGDGVCDCDAEVATLYSVASVVSVPLLHLLFYQSASMASHSGHVLVSPLRSALDKIDITTSCI
ncbi:WD40 repeat-like protein [Mycena venus]|uniref:WD40 repeat-like protein n=1 Tax=Mycena venus TaxID=2733690 RepID=A0A8H6X2R1_9AGAR|nr:WD40 repeat-like protein [Mycena venus]